MDKTTTQKNQNTVKDGSKVSLHYTGSLDTGEVFDSSVQRGTPVEFKIGTTPLIKGFQEALIGMKQDEEKEITIKPEEAYGQRDEALVQKIPKSQFPEKLELKEGAILTLKDPEGHMVLAKVSKIEPDAVYIDLNHLLAGKNLKFKIKVLSVE